MRLVLIAAALAIASPGAAQPSPSTIEPAQLELARTTVEAVWPLGTYKRMMDGAMSQMMDSMTASMFHMKVEDFLAAMPEAERQKAQAELGAGKTMRDLMLMVDPHFQERMRLTNQVMWSELTPLLTRMEPAIRDGLARAYARRFTAVELGDMNRFFATLSGRRYASESLLLYADPEVVTLMSRSMPEMMKAMPAIMEKVEAATAHLPKPAKSKADN